MTATVEQQVSATDHTLTVIHTRCTQLNVPRRFQTPAQVEQPVIQHELQAGIHRPEYPAAVVQLAGHHLHGLGGRHGAGQVAQALGLYVQGATSAEGAVVVEQLTHVETGRTTGGKRATAVVQVLGTAHFEGAALRGDDRAIAGVEGTRVEHQLAGLGLPLGEYGVLRRQLQAAVTGQGARLAVELIGLHRQLPAAGVFDLALLVIQVAGLQGQVLTIAGDAPVVVIQRACGLDAGSALARLHQLTTDVGNVLGRQLQVTHVDLRTVAAQGANGAGIERACTVDLAVGQVQVTLSCIEPHVTGLGLATLQVDAFALQVERAAGMDLAIGRDLFCAGLQAGIATGLACAIDASRQQGSLAVAERGGLDIHIALASQHATVCHATGAGHLQ